MSDYVTAATSGNCHYPLSDSLSYAHISPTYQYYLMIEAIKDKIKALEDNKIWELVHLPPGKPPIGCKWVYKMKFKANRDIKRYKARLVAKREDHHDEVYMSIPEGFSSQGKNKGLSMRLTGSEPSCTLLDNNIKLTIVEVDRGGVRTNDGIMHDRGVYQRLIGGLLYLTLTRPNICFIVQTLSQFMHQLKISHMNAALKMVKYVKREPERGILMSSRRSTRMKAYCDVD
ncbi:uncharacterized protein LOC142165068 [Nicotiana tabacum]|uniref:Uncharacterized protein LOC142165068 n=1 Tax=Nicotiana tabacum TaxID=4097 RepID=A0AC58S494_TOBAC